MATFLRYLKQVEFTKAAKWILTNPAKAAGLGSVVGYPIIDRYLKKKSEKEKKVPIYNKLEQGSRPSLIQQPMHVIYRPDIITDITNRFFPKPETVTRFGLVIGPSGSGKTYAIKDLCNKYPDGVLYHEIVEPSSFVLGLSAEMCMKTAPSTALDLLLGYINKRYTHYYVLPASQHASLDMVLDTLKDAAIQYQQNHGKVPVLFLDGVDLLAKYDKELCCRLITHAKVLANEGILRIVLVSSEGNIMPLLEVLSAMNRALMYEIGDVCDEKALEYLMNNDVCEDTGRKLVECIGGRIIHLESCVVLMQIEGWNAEDVCERAKSSLFERILNGQKLAISRTWPESGKILKVLASNRYIVPAELLKEIGSHELDKALEKLIDANILRYTEKGHVTWHGRVQQQVFGNLTYPSEQ